MTAQYFIMDDLDVVGTGFLVDFEDVRNAIAKLPKQDAVTVVRFNLRNMTAMNVTLDVAETWPLSSDVEIPEFVRVILSDDEIGEKLTEEEAVS